MAAESTRFTLQRPTATAHATPAQGWPFDYERALLVAAFAAQVVSFFFHAGAAGFVGPEVPMLLPGLLGAALVAWRVRRWTFAAAGVLLALLPVLVLVVFGAAAQLGSPTHGNGYTSVLFLLMSLVLAVPAALVGARRERRGQPPAPPTWRVGVVLLTSTFLLGAMVAGALASASLTSGGGAAGYDFTPEARATVLAKDFDFPPEVPLAAGVVTELVVQNQDPAFHTFTYQVGGTTYNHDVPGNSAVKFLVKLEEPGRVQYWCAPHSGGAPGAKTGMVGTLVVA